MHRFMGGLLLAPRCQLVKVVAGSGYSRSALAAAAARRVCAGDGCDGGDAASGVAGGWRPLVVDLSGGVFTELEVSAAFYRGMFGAGAAEAEADAADLLYGHLRLLGAWAAQRLVVVVSEADAAAVYEGGEVLQRLLQRLREFLPRAVVVLTSSADVALSDDEVCLQQFGGETLALADGEAHVSSWGVARTSFVHM